MTISENDEGKLIEVLYGLIPPGSSVPSVDFAMHISEKIEEYMNLLGFKGVEVYKASPFEIFIGATK